MEISDTQYLLNIVKNFGLMSAPFENQDPTMYHTGSYVGDLKIYNRLKLMQSNQLSKCICVYEPRGDFGQDFQLSCKYCFKKIESYYRVYPDESDGYYETCSKQSFNKYFKLLDKKER